MSLFQRFICFINICMWSLLWWRQSVWEEIFLVECFLFFFFGCERDAVRVSEEDFVGWRVFVLEGREGDLGIGTDFSCKNCCSSILSVWFHFWFFSAAIPTPI